MKKLLFQFDTDQYPSGFDAVVAYDGGVDHIIRYGAVDPDNVRPLVEGAIFTRPPRDKRFTAIFVGGSDMAAGERLFKAVQRHFFHDFRVSLMLDSNGSNTTAAAGTVRLLQSGKIAGCKAVVLAGTGPVGQRAAGMLVQAGAHVTITSRVLARAEKACQAVQAQFGQAPEPVEAVDHAARARVIEDAQVVFSTGMSGVNLLEPGHWQENQSLRLIADANATPPLGIGGTEMNDKGRERCGKIIWGAIGFGTLKLAAQKACIAKLFSSNDQLLDAEQIFAITQSIA